MVRQLRGGIVGLAVAVSRHRRELTDDFRALYSTSLYDTRGPELADLIWSLLNNPASSFHAAVAGWKFPVSREALYQLDLLDLLLMRWQGEKYKPFPRPSDVATARKGKSPEAAMRQLRPHLFKDN